MKKEIPDKIQWNGYKKQLTELFRFLVEKELLYDLKLDAFLSHFTSKNGTPFSKNNYGKLDWLQGKYLIGVLINYLIDKRFILHDLDTIKYSVIEKHFKGIVLKSFRKQYEKYKKNATTKQLFFGVYKNGDIVVNDSIKYILPYDALDGKEWYFLYNKPNRTRKETNKLLKLQSLL